MNITHFHTHKQIQTQQLCPTGLKYSNMYYEHKGNMLITHIYYVYISSMGNTSSCLRDKLHISFVLNWYTNYIFLVSFNGACQVLEEQVADDILVDLVGFTL